jgi:hypothetical protein
MPQGGAITFADLIGSSVGPAALTGNAVGDCPSAGARYCRWADCLLQENHAGGQRTSPGLVEELSRATRLGLAQLNWANGVALFFPAALIAISSGKAGLAILRMS